MNIARSMPSHLITVSMIARWEELRGDRGETYMMAEMTGNIQLPRYHILKGV